jgi:DNA-binding XRE family transcriptional regulator
LSVGFDFPPAVLASAGGWLLWGGNSHSVSLRCSFHLALEQVLFAPLPDLREAVTDQAFVIDNAGATFETPPAHGGNVNAHGASDLEPRDFGLMTGGNGSHETNAYIRAYITDKKKIADLRAYMRNLGEPMNEPKHVLAKVRAYYSLTQERLAELLDYKRITIQSIELGKLALSSRLAAQIETLTGFSADYLLRNDVSEEMPKPAETRKVGDRVDRTWMRKVVLIDRFSDLIQIVEATKPGQDRLLSHHLNECVNRLLAAYGIPQETFTKWPRTGRAQHANVKRFVDSFDPNLVPLEPETATQRQIRKVPR